ncbi:MAG: hypothetical protein Q9195_003491 [Heterodermia aff. obscurata]
MEPLSAVSSIVGILAFTGQALKAIDSFYEFCKGFSEEATRDFLHDLEITAGILNEVKFLCEKVKDADTTLSIDYRADALGIQVDDCSRDLHQWLRIAMQMKKERGGSLRRAKLHFFNSVLTAISKSARTSAREKLRWHQENIRTTLSLLGRHIDLANTATLHNFDISVQKTSRKLLEKSRSLEGKISSLSNSLSSSTDSLQAQNSNISEQLSLVTSLLQQALSSGPASSRPVSSNPSSSNPSWSSLPRSKISFKEQRNADEKLRLSLHQDRNPMYEHPMRQSTAYTESSAEDVNADADFETIFRATKGLITSIQQIYHPLIADFLATRHAWNTLELQIRCLNVDSVSDTWAHNYDRVSGVRRCLEMKRAAGLRLLSVEKQCADEGLSELLNKIISETENFGSEQLWEEIKRETKTDQKMRLLHVGEPLEAEERSKDRLTRINEWLLGVFYAYPVLNDLHQEIMRREITKLRKIPSVSLDESLYEPATAEEDPRRKIIKYWFLDSAAMSDKQYPSSHMANSDSEATFRDIEDVEKIDDSDEKNDDPDMNISNQVMVPAPSLQLDLKNNTLKELDYEAHRLGPPQDQDPSRILDAAEQAMRDYNKEPCVDLTRYANGNDFPT